MRDLFLTGAFLFLGLFGTLTVYVMAHSGVTIVGLLAVLIIGMIGLGVIGAFRNPPDDR